MAIQINRPAVAQYYHNTKESPHKGYYRVLQLSQHEHGDWEAFCLSATETFRLPVAVVRQHKAMKQIPFYDWTLRRER